MKQVVFYSAIDYCQVGSRASVVVVSHPRAGFNGIVNGGPVLTSVVQRILEHGAKPMFETKNSLYSPIEKWKEEEDAERKELEAA